MKNISLEMQPTATDNDTLYMSNRVKEECEENVENEKYAVGENEERAFSREPQLFLISVDETSNESSGSFTSSGCSSQSGCTCECSISDCTCSNFSGSYTTECTRSSCSCREQQSALDTSNSSIITVPIKCTQPISDTSDTEEEENDEYNSESDMLVEVIKVGQIKPETDIKPETEIQIMETVIEISDEEDQSEMAMIIIDISSEEEGDNMDIQPVFKKRKLWKLTGENQEQTTSGGKKSIEYSFSTHTITREQVSPLQKYAVDSKDMKNDDGEAECRTPSPARNGFNYIPMEPFDFNRYESSEVDFHMRRERTQSRLKSAQSEESCPPRPWRIVPHSTVTDSSLTIGPNQVNVNPFIEFNPLPPLPLLNRQ